jgi:hypothetical protein
VFPSFGRGGQQLAIATFCNTSRDAPAGPVERALVECLFDLV